MSIVEKIQELAQNVEKRKDKITTEEATKNAIVMPFINKVLGYDIFDPEQVCPEYTADVGIKKGEKVDYAIFKDDEVQMIVECKKINDDLSLKHAGQLYRYFSVTKARIAILTNGIVWQFYTDLDTANKMDEDPFWILDINNIDEVNINRLEHLVKDKFNIDEMISSAEALKYTNLIRKEIHKQLTLPSEDFIKVFASKLHQGKVTEKVRETFKALIPRAFKIYLNHIIKLKLSSVIEESESNQIDEERGNEDGSAKGEIITTEEELEGFYIVKAILRQHIDLERVVYRDTINYFGILLDDNNRKPICRLHFNTKQKYISTFENGTKNERKAPLGRLDDLYNYGDEIIASLNYQLATEDRKSA